MQENEIIISSSIFSVTTVFCFSFMVSKDCTHDAYYRLPSVTSQGLRGAEMLRDLEAY